MVSFKVLTAVVLPLVLTGCKTTGSLSCPNLVEYSAAFQAEAATEQEIIKRYTPQSAALLDDYRKLRKALRHCK